MKHTWDFMFVINLATNIYKKVDIIIKLSCFIWIQYKFLNVESLLFYANFITLYFE